MEDVIKKLILSCGADVCGIANITRFESAPRGFSPNDIYKDCRSVIVFGKALPKGLAQVDSRLIYAHYNSLVCSEVDKIALNGAKLLEKEFSANAVPIPCDTPYEYWEEDSLTGKGLISMKHAAVLAGIGELGKNSLLINSQYGNLLTIGAILTDLELQSDELCSNICIDNCLKCVKACPINAIEDGTVNQKLCRRNAYGKTKRGFDTVDCNKCRVVCPRKYGLNEKNSNIGEL